jgi:hypothetical protein
MTRHCLGSRLFIGPEAGRPCSNPAPALFPKTGRSNDSMIGPKLQSTYEKDNSGDSTMGSVNRRDFLGAGVVAL